MIIEAGAVKFGEFVLSSGKKSNVYIDLRTLISHPSVYIEIINESRRIIEDLKFDAIAGIPTGGLVWASFIAFDLKKPLIYVRKEEKGHGTKKIIEGNISKGSKVLLVDDVATTGSSLMSTAEILISEGYLINDAFVIVDREEGARERLEQKNIRLRSLFKLNDFLN